MVLRIGILRITNTCQLFNSNEKASSEIKIER